MVDFDVTVKGLDTTNRNTQNRMQYDITAMVLNLK
jgi:hypothetical protein